MTRKSTYNVIEHKESRSLKSDTVHPYRPDGCKNASPQSPP